MEAEANPHGTCDRPDKGKANDGVRFWRLPSHSAKEQPEQSGANHAGNSNQWVADTADKQEVQHGSINKGAQERNPVVLAISEMRKFYYEEMSKVFRLPI